MDDPWQKRLFSSGKDLGRCDSVFPRQKPPHSFMGLLKQSIKGIDKKIGDGRMSATVDKVR